MITLPFSYNHHFNSYSFLFLVTSSLLSFYSDISFLYFLFDYLIFPVTLLYLLNHYINYLFLFNNPPAYKKKSKIAIEYDINVLMWYIKLISWETRLFIINIIFSISWLKQHIMLLFYIEPFIFVLFLSLFYAQ